MNCDKAFLADLINYADRAVVSRELLRKQKSTLTLFAFDKGQGLSEHTAPFDAFVYIIEGEAQITVSNKPIALKAGETIVMPANKSHSITALGRFKMLLVMLRE